MDRAPAPLRSLPRVFLPGADPEDEAFELPQAELDKLRKVLRMQAGDPLALLPNDGSVLRCRLEGRRAIVEARELPSTEPTRRLRLAQALPKGDRLETVVRMGTEIGVAEFLIFPAHRSVAQWDAGKRRDRLRRLEAIARESAEQSFRTVLPRLEWADSLADVLRLHPSAIALHEGESVRQPFREALAAAGDETTLAVGPEGGWDRSETELIGDRAATLGPLVLRTDTAGLAAAALALLG